MRDLPWSYERGYARGLHWEEAQEPHVDRFIELVPRGRVLDAGCGSGRISAILSRAGYDVVGVDACGTAIAKARARGAAIPFARGDLERLCFPGSSFDAVYAGYSLEDTAYGRSIAELARILRPGGIAHLLIHVETRYDTPCAFDQQLDADGVVACAEEHFTISARTCDAYREVGERGPHTHRRLILELERRANSTTSGT